MPDFKFEIRPDLSARVSGDIKLSEIHLSPVGDVAGDKVEFTGSIFANSAMRKALSDPNSFKGDLKLLEDIPFAVNLKTEKGTIDINNEMIKIQLHKLPVTLVSGPDRIFASSEWGEVLGTDFSKPTGEDYDIKLQLRMDAEQPEDILRSFSIRKDSLLTRCVLSENRQAIYIVHSDPDNKLFSAFKFVNQEAVEEEGQAKLRELGIIIKKDDKCLEVNYNHLKDSYDIKGSFGITERLSANGSFQISEAELREALGFTYKIPSFGKIGFDAGFNQTKDGESGFRVGLNVDIAPPAKRR